MRMKGDGIARRLIEVNEHCQIYHTVYKIVPGFSPREFLLRTVYRKLADGTVEIAWETTQHPSLPLNPKWVRATTTTLARFKSLPDDEGVPQTRVEYFFQTNLGGSIPPALVNRAAVNQLVYLSEIRSRCDHSKDIDRCFRRRFVGHESSQAYSKEEEEVLKVGTDLLSEVVALNGAAGVKKTGEKAARSDS